MTILVPIRTVSCTNAREHWRVRAKRVKEERIAVAWLLRPAFWHRRLTARLPCTVTLTRIAPRDVDDDNLRGALKGCRDEVAAHIGVDDRDERITWRYGQRRGRVREYAVEIHITVSEMSHD